MYYIYVKKMWNWKAGRYLYAEDYGKKYFCIPVYNK